MASPEERRRRLPFASSLGPVIVIEPGTDPPAPRFTVTRQVPACSDESAPDVSLFGSKLRWIASCGFLLSWIAGCP